MSNRRWRWLAGVAAAVVLLAGCSSGGGGGGNTASGGSSSAGGGKHYRIGVSFYSNVIPLYVQMQQGMQDKAKQLGVTLEFSVANNSAEEQSNQINTFVTKGEDLILASPVDATALAPAYQAARGASIPIISVANKLDNASLEDAYVGPDLVDQAYRTMERVVQGMGGKGNLLLITGPPQIAFVQAQKAGWQKSLAKHPDVHVVDTVVDADLSTSGALDAATSALAAHPDVTGILCSDDDIAMGAIKAAQGRGLDLSKVYIAGWDGSPAAVAALKAKTYDLTLSEKPYTWGQIAVQTAVDWLNGKKPSGHRVNVPDIFIDQENVNTLTADQIR
jgi:ABC-type sugar transport system substrate-binding protein